MTRKQHSMWIFNPTLRRQLTNQSNGESKKLHSTDCKILELLCKNQGETVLKSTLIDVAWPGRVVSQASLTQSIAHLRIALGDNGRQQNIIKTVPKHGYLLVSNIISLEVPIVLEQNNSSTPSSEIIPDTLQPQDHEKTSLSAHLQYLQRFILLTLSLLFLVSLTWLTRIIYYNSTTDRIQWNQREHLGVTYYFTDTKNGDKRFNDLKGRYSSDLRMLYISENPEQLYVSCVYQPNNLHEHNTMNFSFSRDYSIEQVREEINEQCQ
ncbi:MULTISPECIES: winged helix-turn-helix domain-containing protein [Vibrio]|uniref:Transcriptional activator CadC n=1 Tax=Vibrio atlanticus TaxID=693153 RepID=A0A1C3IJ40_9VIBR|nr:MULTISPECIES: winged helix-turn-helix domain-containing protein [Vibrio]MCC4860875.1 winged helix-turn-helix domain-containing protein [Vibrio splendidus]SBS61379.1 Transcriptional activator CadC [Vibrio atlanticus]